MLPYLSFISQLLRDCNFCHSYCDLAKKAKPPRLVHTRPAQLLNALCATLNRLVVMRVSENEAGAALFKIDFKGLRRAPAMQHSRVAAAHQ